MNRRFINRRRLIPVFIATSAFVVAISPLTIDSLEEDRANRWTLLAVVIMFACKAALFSWMRFRMINHPKPLTVFGLALVDFFGAITIADIFLSVIFGIGWWYAEHGNQIAPLWIRITDRAILIAGAAYVISTGLACAYEMYIAGASLDVHERKT